MPNPTTHITTSGGLISDAFIENIRELGSRQRGVEPTSFALPWLEAPRSPAVPEDTIATAWELLLERWDAIRADLPMMEVSQVRSRWLLPLFSLLDFEPVYQRGDTVLDEDGSLRFSLSHRGWDAEGAPVLHTVITSQDLDARIAAGRGVKAKSPHDMLQAFLNASTGDLWAVLSNGILLRLLRDYHHTFTKGYVQFDLENIFETRNYGDFRALYRMCHASRFIPQGEGDDAIPPLERFYKDSIATGIRVGEDLRGQVRQAIETLGNGFLDGDLIRRLQQDEALCRRYYGEILHIIYRLLFLLFAEQRGMMPGRDSLYAETYSIARLRARAEGDIPREDDFADLCEGLRVTFRMLREGVPELGVFGYDGMLFEDDAAGATDQPSLLEGRGCRNSDLLRAIRALTLIEREGVLQRISYADLGVEELGAIYESLLDFTARVTTVADDADGREIPANTFFLDPRGSERKTTGSYYTHPSLVNELIKSALLPVARDRLKAAGLPVIEEEEIGEATAGLLSDYAGLIDEQRRTGEEALLSIKVCDPAVGSGHFLVKANNALGAELARICTGDEYPTEDQVQAAKRDVLAHCIYAVDVNPMAVELCKVSLWINASVRDRPLSFLDHHIKCGNSLIGATPELMAKGIPYQAFDQKIVGNDRATANAIRKRNREEQKGQLPLRWQVTVIETAEDLGRWRQLTQLAEEEPKAARERYEEYRAAADYQRQKLEVDCWTAAFFWPLPKNVSWVPTHGEFVRLRTESSKALSPESLAQVEALPDERAYNFFHWHLEFRDVFTDDGTGGFDVVLGNPPWERVKLQEKEFFADKDPDIANARTAAERRRLIRQLPKSNPALHAAYAAALRDSEATSHFLRESGHFPLSAAGDVNTYQVFAGLARQIVGPRGRAGVVLPSGIATDYYNQDFFVDLATTGRLVSLYDFENRRGIFPEVEANMRFSLLTLGGSRVEGSEFSVRLHSIDEMPEFDRRFTLTGADFLLFNPNTRTVPVFRTRRDAALAKKIYRRVPVLVNDGTKENPWGISFHRMFDMTNDSHLFHTREELEVKGLTLEGNRFVCGEEVYLPLYEAKFIRQFDHRFGSYEGVVAENRFRVKAGTHYPTDEQEQAPSYCIEPRYWVNGTVVEDNLPTDRPRRWLVGFRDIIRPLADARCAIFSIFPLTGVGNTLPLMIINRRVRPSQDSAFLANVNSFIYDYVARQKAGGAHLNFYVVKQLPILPPDRYRSSLLDFIVPRVVELTYTAWDLQRFAQDILDEVGPETWARWFRDVIVHTSPSPAWASGPTPAPFVWDGKRRAHLRTELDGLYAHLYGLTREELDYILDTFPIVRRRDEERYGEYRTNRLVLEAYEEVEPLMH
jgi:hypothetical protein